MSPPEPVLRAEGLGKRYRRGSDRHHVRSLDPRRGVAEPNVEDGFDALVDVSFEVHAGEAVGVVGANGAGKTTLLKAVTGLVQPSSGRVCHRGRVASVIELGVGFHPDLTGAENVRLTAALHGLGRAEVAARRARIVEFSGIGDAIDTPVKWYSTGMLARLGFALAAHLDADLLLVDEVMSVGDEEFRHRCFDRLLELRDAGATLLVVSHDLLLVDQLCSRALRLEHGRLVDDGPSHDVLDRYAGGGAGTGASWEGAPARIHALTLDPPRITSGEGFRVHLELEVLRAVEGLHLEFETRPRMPGIELAPGASARALHSELALEVGDRPGRWSLVAEVDALPTSAGAYECEVSLLERADAAPLGVTRARLEVVGPREAHPMVVLDARWTLEYDEGPVEEQPGG